jgi:hypothetical protein
MPGINSEDWDSGSGGFTGHLEHGTVTAENEQEITLLSQLAGIGCRGNCVESCELSSDRVAENLFPQAFELGDSLSDDRDASRFLGIGDQANPSE